MNFWRYRVENLVGRAGQVEHGEMKEDETKVMKPPPGLLAR